jgi:beta-catenin-like protein 1
MDVVNRAMANFEGGDADTSIGQAFIPSSHFQGPKAGYYFTNGPQGTGYYLDEPKKKVSSNMPPGFADDDDINPRHRPTAEELLEEAEEAAGDANLQIVDAKVLKKLVSTLERKYNQNVEARIKYSLEPQKFLESEIELDEAVRAMTAVATSPELYPDLVATTGAVGTFISLIHHENGDIAAAAIELLSELTDTDAVEDSEAEAGVLVDALLDGGLLEALVHRLRSLNESIAEEAAAVYNALSLIENAVELRPEVAAVAAGHPGLLDWMLKRLRPKTVSDGNKQYTAEVLAVILQSGGEVARKEFVDLNGVELMLRAVAPYKARDPETAEEEEFIENAFDVLCAVLMEPGAKKAFVEADGAELMALILKARTAARTGALKCLDFATTRCPPACDQLVDFGGLGTVFALFMGKLKSKKGKNGRKRDDTVIAEEEQRCMSLVCNLLSDVTSDTRRARVAAKFTENEFEKCDRLMEIYSLYEERVIDGEAQLAATLQQQEEEIDEDEVLMARLDAGLFTLQQAAVVAAELWALGDLGVRKRLLNLLHQRGRTLSNLREVLVERRATLAAGLVDGGEEKGGEEREGEEEEGRKQVERATVLLQALGYQEEEGQGKEGGGDDEVEENGDAKEERKKRSREEDEGDGDEPSEPNSTRQKI